MRVIIADDERIARARLRHLLASEADVEIVGECSNGRQTVALLNDLAADVLFLDIQMPGVDGMSIAKRALSSAMPFVVFVTAYDEYAIEAFAVRAFDYLLKPFDRERFLQTLNCLRAELTQGRRPSMERVNQTLSNVRHRSGFSRLAVRNRGKVSLVDLGNIDWIEAADNYVCIHCGQATHVVRETLSAMEARLDSSQFVRIHRSAIVNVSRIREIQPWFRGDSRVLLENGTTLTLSRTFRAQVNRHLFGSAAEPPSSIS